MRAKAAGAAFSRAVSLVGRDIAFLDSFAEPSAIVGYETLSAALGR
jgi:hypothetical protein